MTTIPADLFSSVSPSVLGAGGNTLDIIGLFLTSSTRPPIGSVLSFPDSESVQNYFGLNSTEAALAAIYFSGFANDDGIPGALLFSQYNSAAVSAYMRGGNVGAALTLTQLQAISGSLSIVIDGVTKSGNPNLASATSFSNAATIIADTLDIEAGAGASFTGTISGTTLTVSSVTGTIAIGQLVDGVGTTAGTYITAGSGLSWTVNVSQTVGPVAMTTGLPGVTFDSVSGGFVVNSNTTGVGSTMAFATGSIAASLFLTSATGAVLSQGAAAASPAAFMNAVIVQNQNWVTFTTLFDPDGGSGNTVKQAFAAWKNSALGGNRFCYVCWDTDVTPTNTLPATASLGQILAGNGDSGTCLLEGDPAAGWNATAGAQLAAFVCGAAASIDFEETNGRISFAFKRPQATMTATVVNSAVAVNLGGNPQVAGSFGNNYNYFGAVGSANGQLGFTWFQRGTVTGDFKWLDSYINQIWMNNSFQADALTLFDNSKSIPYTPAGENQIESAYGNTITAARNFGAFAPGDITAAQQTAVNQAAGASIAQTLQTQGSYLQVLAASGTNRASRVGPPCKFWYLDRGSVQSLSLDSTAVQ